MAKEIYIEYNNPKYCILGNKNIFGDILDFQICKLKYSKRKVKLFKTDFGFFKTEKEAEDFFNNHIKEKKEQDKPDIAICYMN